MTKENKILSDPEMMQLYKKYEINNNGSIDENQLTKLVTDIYKKSHNINELDNLDLNIIKNSVVKLPIINDDIRDGNMQIYESVKNSKVKGITNSP
jgi:hypothetical protein